MCTGAIIDLMNVDATWLFLSLIPGGIGFVLFVYGKKQHRWPHMLAGVIFNVYPYFTPTSLSMTLVGVTVGTALWLAVRAGY